MQTGSYPCPMLSTPRGKGCGIHRMRLVPLRILFCGCYVAGLWKSVAAVGLRMCGGVRAFV